MADGQKIVDLTELELIDQGFLGDGVPPQVVDLIMVVKRFPEHFQWLNAFHLRCLNAHTKHRLVVRGLVSLNSNTSSKIPVFRQSDDIAVEPDLVSEFERVHFYAGISYNPPPLLHRSDIQQRPFAIPQRWNFPIPKKTIHGVVHEALDNGRWKSTVALEIITWLKEPERKVQVSTMVPVRFSVAVEGGPDVYDEHVTIMISVHTGTTSETSCRDANPGILSILRKHGVDDAAVHWIEGAAEPFVGMMRIVYDTDPTSYIRRAVTAILGVPLASDRVKKRGAEGTLGLYFREGNDHKGNASEKVFATTGKHVTCEDHARDYEYSGRNGQVKEYIRICSDRRFEQMVNETRASMARKLTDSELFAEQLAVLLTKPESEDEDAVESDKMVARRLRVDMERFGEDLIILEDFLKFLESGWSDLIHREAGWLHWAPKIRHDLDNGGYTCDLAVFELESSKWKKYFKGNFAYLGGKFHPSDIASFFYPNAVNPPSFKYPINHLLKIQDWVSADDLTKPYFWDDHGNPCSIVAKVAQSTDLTFGRCSGLEAYTCDKSGNESWEVAIFNFHMESFSAKGDSGGMVFNAEGKMVAFLHSGMPRGSSNHVTFGTPAWYVIGLIKERYPNAVFDFETF